MKFYGLSGPPRLTADEMIRRLNVDKTSDAAMTVRSAAIANGGTLSVEDLRRFQQERTQGMPIDSRAELGQ